MLIGLAISEGRKFVSWFPFFLYSPLGTYFIHHVHLDAPSQKEKKREHMLDAGLNGKWQYGGGGRMEVEVVISVLWGSESSDKRQLWMVHDCSVHTGIPVMMVQ